MIRFDGQRAVVWGLGRHGGGVAVTRYLAQRGAHVLVIDNASKHELAESIQQLDGLNRVAINTGRGLSEVTNETADLLIVNPAISPSHKDLATWRAQNPAGVVTSEINLLLAELGARQIDVVAVTGSNGKTSVCQWLTKLLEARGRWSRVLLGGNFEPGLCDECDQNLLDRLADATVTIAAPAVAVLELSSFQLAMCDLTLLRPLVGAVTNVSRNHLDWHSSFEDYITAKERLIAACLDKGRPCILPLPANDPLRKRHSESDLAIVPTTISGRHGLTAVDATNAATVVSVGRALGFEWTDDDLLKTLPAVAHRRERVGEADGIQFVNDSASTTPESTIALLQSLKQGGCSIVGLIAGGRNKGFDLTSFAEAMRPHVDVVACIGETGDELTRQLTTIGVTASQHESLEDAVEMIRARSKSGDVIALSPGMASTDMFRDYRDRGDRFRQIVHGPAENGSDSRSIV